MKQQAIYIFAVILLPLAVLTGCGRANVADTTTEAVFEEANDLGDGTHLHGFGTYYSFNDVIYENGFIEIEGEVVEGRHAVVEGAEAAKLVAPEARQRMHLGNIGRI